MKLSLWVLLAAAISAQTVWAGEEPIFQPDRKNPAIYAKFSDKQIFLISINAQRVIEQSPENKRYFERLSKSATYPTAQLRVLEMPSKQVLFFYVSAEDIASINVFDRNDLSAFYERTKLVKPSEAAPMAQKVVEQWQQKVSRCEKGTAPEKSVGPCNFEILSADVIFNKIDEN